VSYELALGLSAIGVVMAFGTLDLNRIVESQGRLLFGFLPEWGVVVQPLAAVLFIVAAIAECNRTPFDLPEGESEIIGYHVEYSSLKFALFFMAEYVNIVVAAALTATLFFGGWQIPWLPTRAIEEHAGIVAPVALGLAAAAACVLALLSLRWSARLRRLYDDARRNEGAFWAVVLFLVALAAAGGAFFTFAHPLAGTGAAIFARILQFGTFIGKVVFFSFAFIWVRWTLPRFRYDQLMALGWKNLLPLALANIAATGVVLHWVGR
jgi:NADH-quinone oxidoreductase subunit H